MTLGFRDDMSPRENYKDRIERLKAACEWAGLSRGRATLYAKHIENVFTGSPNREDLYASNESYEITDIYESWQNNVKHFPGIKEKISETLQSGALIAEDETLLNSRARNDAFSFLLAGKMLAAGIDVLAVEGVPAIGQSDQWKGDITINLVDRILDVQCKRPFTKDTIIRRAEEGAKQIKKAGRPGAGIIAMDLSKATERPKDQFSSPETEAQMQKDMLSILRKATPMDSFFRMLKNPKLIGFIVFGRIPAMVGTPSSYVPFSACQTFIIARPREILLKRLSEQLNGGQPCLPI